jgi:HEAT repeat protein
MVDVDDEIINALFSTLTNDNNTNVRLEALDALVRYSDRPMVRVGLIESLAAQNNPLVQLGLADIMVLLQDKKAKDALQTMLESKDLTEDVREVIKERLNSINI